MSCSDQGLSKVFGINAFHLSDTLWLPKDTALSYIKGIPMAGYQRRTILSPAKVFLKADVLLPEWIGLKKSKSSIHSATYVGTEGTVTLSAHRHGAYTDVVASSDRMRTSRMDYEIQKFLTELPYEPGDAGGRGSGNPS